MPGESKKVPPATAKHPAVVRYIGRGLELVNTSKEEPKAPAPPAPAPQSPPPAAEPTPAPVEEPASEEVTESETETEDETAGKDLREDYLSAPGITEANLDVILDEYPTYEALANAEKEDLCDLGVTKSYVKRLKVWASEKLDS